MTGTITLKKSMTSTKFGVVFPAGLELNCFVDGGGRIFAEHPTKKNLYMKLSKKEKQDFKSFN